MLASRQRSLEASPAGPVAAHRAQQPPQQPQGTPMDVVRLAHAAADRVLQRVSHPLASTPACLSRAPVQMLTNSSSSPYWEVLHAAVHPASL